MGIEKVVKTLGWCSAFLARIGCVSLFLMMCLTVVDVGGRFFFNSPILGSFELTQYLVAITIFSFIGYAQSNKIHVNVDLLVNTFPRKLRYFFDILNFLVCLGLMLLFTWMTIEKALEVMATGERPMNLPIPQYPVVFFIAVGCGVTCIEFARDIVKTIVMVVKKEEKQS